MYITKKQLAEKIKRRLGYPMVKVELHPRQIEDTMDYARDNLSNGLRDKQHKKPILHVFYLPVKTFMTYQLV